MPLHISCLPPLRVLSSPHPLHLLCLGFSHHFSSSSFKSLILSMGFLVNLFKIKATSFFPCSVHLTLNMPSATRILGADYFWEKADIFPLLDRKKGCLNLFSDGSGWIWVATLLNKPVPSGTCSAAWVGGEAWGRMDTLTGELGPLSHSALSLIGYTPNTK